MSQNANDGVSIVTLNWNGKQWLDRLVGSLLAQDYPNFEVIIVDNGSTDDSVKYIETKYKTVRLIKSPVNLGFAGGTNLGIRSAKNNLILIINNDTWIEPNLLRGLVDYAEKTKLDVVAPQEAEYETRRTRKNYVTTLDPLGHPAYLYGDKYNSNHNLYLSGVCLLFSKELYEETDGMDSDFFMYFEEVDWFWRMKLYGKTFGYAPKLHVYHAGAGSSEEGALKYNSFLWRNENTLQMLLKNYRLINLIWVLPLYFLQNIIEACVFLMIGKPRIAKSYILGWLFNAKSIRKIITKRRTIQHHRVYGDLYILKSMYKGSAKLRHMKMRIIKQKRA